jgi:hypothetical protein
MKNYEGKIVEVTWLDAMGESKSPKSKIDSCNPSDLLIINKTYGIFYKEDKKAIIIVQEDSQDDIDFTVIPKPWIIKGGIKILKYS